jgi:hypothetical protein
MAGCLVGLRQLWPNAGTAESLAVGIPLGMALYAAFLTAIAPHRLRETVDTLRQARRARA